MIDLLIDQRRRSIGLFEVGRVLPYAKRRMVGPFVFFDHMGPARFAAGLPPEADVLPHPHIGLSTVTYLFDGEIMHRDSVGSEQPIRPGEVNWMTAGRGITHSERFEKARAAGGPMHGIQAWVALPDGEEERDPDFVHVGDAALPVLSDTGMEARLIAGSAFGLTAPVPTFSPLFYLHVALAPKAAAELPAEHPEQAVFVVDGTVTIDGQSVEAGRMAVLARGSRPKIVAQTRATLMVLGGAPVGPRFIEWNFVSSSRERIEEAKADWRAGRMKLPDLDHDSFVPLPPDPKGLAPKAG